MDTVTLKRESFLNPEAIARSDSIDPNEVSNMGYKGRTAVPSFERLLKRSEAVEVCDACEIVATPKPSHSEEELGNTKQPATQTHSEDDLGHRLCLDRSAEVEGGLQSPEIDNADNGHWQHNRESARVERDLPAEVVISNLECIDADCLGLREPEELDAVASQNHFVAASEYEIELQEKYDNEAVPVEHETVLFSPLLPTHDFQHMEAQKHEPKSNHNSEIGRIDTRAARNGLLDTARLPASGKHENTLSAPIEPQKASFTPTQPEDGKASRSESVASVDKQSAAAGSLTFATVTANVGTSLEPLNRIVGKKEASIAASAVMAASPSEGQYELDDAKVFPERSHGPAQHDNAIYSMRPSASNSVSFIENEPTKPQDLVDFQFSSLSAPKTTGSLLPVEATNISRPIVTQIAHSILKDFSDGTIELRLQPEELGRIRLTMTPNETGVSVHLSVERIETLELVRRNIHLLETELLERGFVAADFSFDSQMMGNGHWTESDAQVPNSEDHFMQNAESTPATTMLQMKLVSVVDGKLDVRM